MCVGSDVGFVSDEHDRVAALVQPREQRHDFRAGLRVQVSRRLVREQDRGVVHERPRDGDALTLAAGQLVGPMRHAARQLDLVERGLRARLPIRRRHTGIDERQLDVVERRRARQQVESLEDEPDFLVADARQLVVVHPRDLLVVQQIAALARRVEAADEVHQRRLARSRGTHDGDVLSALDRNRRTPERVDLFLAHHVRLPQVARLDECHGIRIRALAPAGSNVYIRTSPAWLSRLLVVGLQLRNHARVGQRRRVAERLPFRDVLEQSAHDLP